LQKLTLSQSKVEHPRDFSPQAFLRLKIDQDISPSNIESTRCEDFPSSAESQLLAVVAIA